MGLTLLGVLQAAILFLVYRALLGARGVTSRTAPTHYGSSLICSYISTDGVQGLVFRDKKKRRVMMVSLQSQAQREEHSREWHRTRKRAGKGAGCPPQDLRRVLPGGLDFLESAACDLCLGGIQLKAVPLAPSLSLPQDLVLESGIASCGCQRSPVQDSDAPHA